MSLRIWPTMAAAVSHARHTATTPLVWDPVDHLLSRVTFGPTTAQRAWLAKYGPDAWYAGQLKAVRTYPGYSGSASVAAQGPLLALSPYDVEQRLIAEGNQYGWDAMDQLSKVTLGLQAWSRAQLLEVLTDFFANHLNVPNHNGDLWNTRHTFDRDVVRRYATGSFTQMLLASARNPAMLTYLNLAESTKAAVNENYGRELLECHTVGLHYSENDVQNAARLLTGRTLDDNQHYLFDDWIHPTGRIRVLGFSTANSSAVAGEKAGDDLLRYLASHPDTANHLAQKLCVRLVGDEPPAALVEAVAHAYSDSGTQILPMVSTILRSSTFWESRGAKVRKPAENVIATLRVLGLRATKLPDALNTLMWTTSQLGNLPLDWPAPNGYPDVAQAWRSSGSLLELWNMHLGFAGGWWGGLSNPSAALYGGGKPATSGEAVTMMTRALTGMTFSSRDRATLQRFLDESSSTPMTQSVLRWMAVPLAAVILDGPHHALR